MKEHWMQLAAGGSAGFVETCLMHPLDVVKTRFQLQSNFTSIRACFTQIVKNEGLLAIYKGILPPLLIEVPKRGSKFFSFEQYKKLLSSSGSQVRIEKKKFNLAARFQEIYF
jgi:solute carrier family 25 2-oxodicarboxylate transporter 21